jgi:hypothetical protein
MHLTLVAEHAVGMRIIWTATRSLSSKAVERVLKEACAGVQVTPTMLGMPDDADARA